MKDLLESYLEDQQLRGYAFHTIRAKGIRTRSWLTWCKDRQLDPCQPGREDFLAYLQLLRQEGNKTATLRKIFSNLVSFYEFLEEGGMSQATEDARKIQKKYLRTYKPDGEERQLITIHQAADMIATTFSTRDQAILMLLFKTGIRRGELTGLDVSNVDLEGMTIKLKPTGKRSNRLVFFDHETQAALRRWLSIRKDSDPALFLSSRDKRISGDAVRYAVVNAAKKLGLHTEKAPLEDRFGAHCCRHWFTTHLLRAGMRREYVKWLRGDAKKEAIDTYFQIDPEDVKREYLTYIPRLGI